MTKAELRKARKRARADGLALTGDLALDDRDRDRGPVEFGSEESYAGRLARDRWARRFVETDGPMDPSDY